MNDPRYVDDPFEDETNNSAISQKAREGKTALQRRALTATGRKRFGDKKEHELFKKYEAFAAGADPESRVWAAWLINRVECAESFNKKAINMTMPNLLASFGNKAKRDIWFTDNREKVLRKPSPKELAATLDQGAGEMASRMKTRISKLEDEDEYG
jgi:hypothetical protein